MELLKRFQVVTAVGRAKEEALYQAVADELAAGLRRDGLWTKAVADTDGNEARAKSRYIKLRVQSMKDELALLATEPQAEEISSPQPTEISPEIQKLAEAEVRRAEDEIWFWVLIPIALIVIGVLIAALA